MLIQDTLRQVAKAESWLTFDLRQRIEEVRDATPRIVANDVQKERRKRHLREIYPDGEQGSLSAFERILDGNEIVPSNYLERGMRAARAIARVQIVKPSGETFGYGTGFLIAPGVLITNNHVLPDSQTAQRSVAQFEYEVSADFRDLGPVNFSLSPDVLFFTSEPLDFTVVAVADLSKDGDRSLGHFGVLPLLGSRGKVMDGEWLTIVQHPGGGRKALCVRENKLLRRTTDALWYSTDTLGGSSGSPVFNNDWEVVALHHSGIPERKNGRIQTIDGLDFDPDRMDGERIKWIANEGIRSSRIVDTLGEAMSEHPLLLPIIARAPELSFIAALPSPYTIQKSLSPMSSYSIPIEINTAELAQKIAEELGKRASQTVSDESSRGQEARRRSRFQETDELSELETIPDEKERKGFNEEFLGNDGFRVHLPKLSASIEGDATQRVDAASKEGAEKYILPYRNYSIVMSRSRRFAFFSAANVNFGGRFSMKRPKDRWVFDDRIQRSAQIDNWLYARNQNKFDRGHLTRREDLEWGGSVSEALKSAGDTMVWTNCTPQHSKFNQTQEEWQGLEQHILAQSILANHFKAQVITGPVLDEGDPEYADVQYPLSYWKVVAAVNASQRLFATAYLLSQKDVIDRYGIEAAPEVPFTDYRLSQVPISMIEEITGLIFRYGPNGSPLVDCDPLASRRGRRTRSLDGPRGHENIVL